MGIDQATLGGVDSYLPEAPEVPEAPVKENRRFPITEVILGVLVVVVALLAIQLNLADHRISNLQRDDQATSQALLQVLEKDCPHGCPAPPNNPLPITSIPINP